MIDSSVIAALNFLLKIVLYSFALASPLIILQLMMYGYEHYKKWKKKETKEAERIIVKMNETITKDALVCDVLANEKTKLQLDVESLEKRRKELQIEIGEPVEEILEEKQDLKDLNVKQLKKLAKAQNIKRYSKLNKAELLKTLGS
ncbi:MAG: hypothetical protein K8Q99_02105 [Acholeplasmataceae bacterium]|nr:hypothetical protein [Acholeplasmataceae bacterium]MCD4826559.1 hypothetical protein [Acholeplasmataceae bacterium]